MAWVSVHETVDGPKLRDLYKRLGCSKFEALGILNFLWFWGINNANKDGRILDADKEDISRYLYGVGAGCNLDTKDIVDALFDSGWLDLAPDGHFYLHDWDMWQEQWYNAVQRREKDAARKRESRQRAARSPQAKAEHIETAEVMQETMFQAEEQPTANSEGKYAKAFEEFWKVYPRKIDKGNAYKKYQARLKDGFTDDELILAAKNYATVCQANKTETQYIKHPKTFLSDTLPFLDYIPREGDMPSDAVIEGNPFDDYGD